MNTLLCRGTAVLAGAVLLGSGLAPASVARAADGEREAPISTHIGSASLLGVFGTTVVAAADDGGGVFLSRDGGAWKRTGLDPEIGPTDVTWVGDGKLVALSWAETKVQILDVATNTVVQRDTDLDQARAAAPDFEVDLIGSSLTDPQPVKKDSTTPLGDQVTLAWPAADAAPAGADTATSVIGNGWLSSTAWVAPTAWVDAKYKLKAMDLSYVPLDGSAGFVRRVPGEVLWATNTGASVRYLSLESKTLKDCVVTATSTAKPDCKTIKTKVSGSPVGFGFGQTLGLTIGSTSYLWTTKLVKVTGLPSRTTAAFTAAGTSPVLSVWGKPGFYKVDAKGKASRLAGGLTEPAVVHSLDLGAGYLVGTDSLGANRGWARKLGDDKLGDTVVLSAKARQVTTSAARYGVNATDGLWYYNGGTRAPKQAKVDRLIAQSGPYSLVQASKSSWNLRTDAKVIASGTTKAVGVFGSMVAEISGGWLTVNDYASGTAKQVGLPLEYNSDAGDLVYTGLWGDWVMLGYELDDPDNPGTVVSTTVVSNYLDEDITRNTAISRPSLGDGVVAGYDSDGQAVVWDFIDETSTAIPGTVTAGPVASGTGAVAWASQDDLFVSKLDGNAGGDSAARALWASTSSGTTSAAFWAANGWRAPWTLKVEATKALAEGTLKISDAGGVVKTVTVPAASDGTLSVNWDGTLTDGSYAQGTGGAPYTWELDVAGKDDSGTLRQLTRDAKLTGTIEVENTLVPFPQVKPKIDDTTPVVGQELTADPGPHPVETGGDCTVSYWWYRGSAVIQGADKKTYTVQPADLGQKLSVKVGVDAFYYNEAAPLTSSATAKVARGTLPKATVQLSSGAPRVGVEITASVTGWSDGVVPSYQWYRVNAKKKATKIAGQTALSYTPTSTDKDNWLKLVVTAAPAGYNTSTASATTASAVTVSG